MGLFLGCWIDAFRSNETSDGLKTLNMPCPDPKTLESALNDEFVGSGSRTDVWQHVESCHKCQGVLGQFTDDQDLRAWRDLSRQSCSRRHNELGNECLARLLCDATNDTVGEDATTQLELQDNFPEFSPPAMNGDLGMLDHYRVVREIGRGGMSRVFEAIDTHLGRPVAIKLLLSGEVDQESHERFLREAQAIASIRHANVVAIHGVEARYAARPYIVMELVVGPSLRDVISRTQGLPAREAAEIIATIAVGLHAAHQTGLVHRDIKPSNILLAVPDGMPATGRISGELDSALPRDIVPKLADFGLARPMSVSDDITSTGILAGTPAYISPELIARPDSFSARSDIYALGVTLYETLTGVIPFRGAPLAVLAQIEEGDPPSPCRLNPSIPRDLETICLKAIGRDPHRRYHSACDFADDLRRWLHGEPIRARPCSSIERSVRWMRRNPRVAGLAAAVAALLLLIASGATAGAFFIQATNARLQHEKEIAIAAEIDARNAAEAAMRQRQLALDSLDALVSKVQHQLGTRPGTLQLREEILQTAFDGLARITESVDQSHLDHTTIVAHLRMGEILGSLGRTSESMEQYQQAQRLSQRTVDEAPDDAECLRDLADALFLEGDLHHRAFAHEKAGRLFERALIIRQQLATRLPDDPQIHHAVLNCRMRLIDHKRFAGKIEEAKAEFEDLLAHAQLLSSRFPNDRPLQRSLVIAHNRIGLLSETLGNFTAAQQHLVMSRTLVTALMAAVPGDPSLQQDMAYVLGRLAAVAGQRGDFDVAIPNAEQALLWYRRIAAADPDNTDAQVKLAACWHATHSIRVAQSEYGLAVDALREALTIYQALHEKHSTTSRFPTLAAEVCFHLSEVERRRGRIADSRRYLEDCHNFLNHCRETVDYSESSTAVLRLVVEHTMPALDVVMDVVMAGPTAFEEASSDRCLSSLAKAELAYNLAVQGDFNGVLAVAEQLRAVSDMKPPLIFDITQFLIARACARCVSQMEKDADTGVASRAELIDRCGQFWQQLTARSPATKAWFQQECDFDSVVDDPALQQAVATSSNR